MYDHNEIKHPQEGWTRLTDMLRACYNCSSTNEVLNTVEYFITQNRVTLHRIKPRFGPQNLNLNDVTLNFDYEG